MVDTSACKLNSVNPLKLETGVNKHLREASNRIVSDIHPVGNRFQWYRYGQCTPPERISKCRKRKDCS